jgi:RNA polymerase sigma-70 factor (ECF subfamily)
MNDKFLIWQFKRGSSKALCRIYVKYEEIMLTVAVSLLNDVNAAEDVVHDVFVSFAQSAAKISPNGNLRGYLTTCVANLARDRIRAQHWQEKVGLDDTESICLKSNGPLQTLIDDEQFRQLNCAMAKLPYEQREVVTLHLQAGMTFEAIALSQDISINTVQSRYRYGIEKLRSFLDSEVEK